MAKRGRKSDQPARGRTVRWPKIKAPAHLAEEAREEFVRLAKLLKEAGTLERTDPRLVELYAVNSWLLRCAEEDLARDGPTVKNSRGVAIAHPMLAVVNSTTLRLKALIAELGLSPASAGHGGAVSSGKSKDPWDGLLNVVG